MAMVPLMHLGSIKTVATFANKNFKYLLLNNNCHDSVGGRMLMQIRYVLKTFRKVLVLTIFLL